MKDKIAKLPKWAQQHITSLENENKRLVKSVQGLVGENDESRIYFKLDRHKEYTRIRLPKDGDVYFNIGQKDRCFDEILVGIRYRKELGVNVLHINGGHGYTIKPYASNSVDVVFDK